MSFNGGCLCGQVRYEGQEETGGGHCHCIDCRRSSGSGHCSHMIVAEPGFAVTGTVKFYSSSADMPQELAR